MITQETADRIQENLLKPKVRAPSPCSEPEFTDKQRNLIEAYELYSMLSISDRLSEKRKERYLALLKSTKLLVLKDKFVARKVGLIK